MRAGHGGSEGLAPLSGYVTLCKSLHFLFTTSLFAQNPEQQRPREEGQSGACGLTAVHDQHTQQPYCPCAQPRRKAPNVCWDGEQAQGNVLLVLDVKIG